MNWNNVELLDLVETYAAYEQTIGNRPISSEQGLSDRFDDEIAPLIIEEHGIKGELFEDTDMMNEQFSNWSDRLCKNGEIHPEQYNQYCYVGKYS
jgi:hypothetical protein